MNIPFLNKVEDDQFFYGIDFDHLNLSVSQDCDLNSDQTEMEENEVSKKILERSSVDKFVSEHPHFFEINKRHDSKNMPS